MTTNPNDEELNNKLLNILNDSMAIKSCELINWNLHHEEKNIIEIFFKQHFENEDTVKCEIAKNIFKDCILKMNSNFPKELWQKILENTFVGKKYCDEINKQFYIKEMLMRKITCTDNCGDTKNHSSKMEMSLLRKYNHNDIQQLKDKIQSEVNANTNDDVLANANNIDDDEFEIDGQRLLYHNTRLPTFSHVKLRSQEPTFDRNNINQYYTQTGVEDIEETISQDEQQTRTLPQSTSLPDPIVLKYFCEEDKTYEHNINKLPDIAKKTKLVIELSNKSNQHDVKQMQLQMERTDLFEYEDEKENENIIYHSSTNKTIVYMSINLLLKKVVIEDFCKNNPLVIQGLIEQYSAFLSLDNLINKIISAYNYFTNINHPNTANLISFLNQIIDKELTNNTQIFRSKVFNTILNFYKELSSNETLKSLPPLNIKEIYSSLKKLGKTSMITENVRRSTVYNNVFPINNNDISYNQYFYMLCYNTKDIANELTRITFELFSKVTIKELLCAKFTKSKKKETSPYLTICIERFDNLIYFIIEDIISYDRQRCRAQMIEKWIDVAWECKELGNYNDCLIINTAFCNYIIRNLKKTWKKVDPVYINKLNEIKKLCSFQNVYANIKNATTERSEAGEKFIPYLGLLLKEVSSLEEKFQYVIDDTLINFMKIEKVQRAVNSFLLFKRKAYNIPPNEELKIFEYLKPKTQEDLEIIGDKLEPLFKYEKKNRYGKRQTRTDKYYYEHKLEERSENELGMSKKNKLNNY